METWEIKGHIVEYIDEIHTYLVDGIIVPSITQIIKFKFKDKYANVNPYVLQRASELGTATHKAIEDYCKLGIETDCKELKGFKSLQEQYGFEVIDNEVPIILFYNNQPFACGRLDLVLGDNVLCLGDIKRTSVLDIKYLTYQLNLYRIGYQQCYDKEIKGLKGLHLREDIKNYVDIPIDEEMAFGLLKEVSEYGENNNGYNI